MTQLLVKDAPFNFSKECIQSFDKLKSELTQAPIMIKPDWSLPFEVMCDASGYAVKAVLGIDKHFKPIHYASKIMNEAQENYTTTEKELLAVVFAFDKFCAENLASDHLSRLENPDLGKLTKAEIRDLFPEERLIAVSDKNNEPWYADYANYLTSRISSTKLRNVIADHMKDIMVSPLLQEKSLKPVSTGHKYFLRLPAHTGWSKFAMHVNEPTTSLQGMKPQKYIQIEKAMKRYGVVHQFSTAYYPQINGQVESTNQAIKRILEKTIRNNRKGWSYKLDDALWAFRTTFKTRLGTTPFRIIYGKACHLPINELDEIRLDAYESSISYKERTKRWHDKRIKAPTNYERGDKVIFDKKKLGSC
ncbi:reverse transcriptase domain-containing protein [Tanacetum coccineum]